MLDYDPTGLMSYAERETFLEAWGAGRDWERRSTAPDEGARGDIERLKGYVMGAEDRDEDVRVLSDILSRLGQAVRMALVCAPAWQDQQVPLGLLALVDEAADMVRDTAVPIEPPADARPAGSGGA